MSVKLAVFVRPRKRSHKSLCATRKRIRPLALRPQPEPEKVRQPVFVLHLALFKRFSEN